MYTLLLYIVLHGKMTTVRLPMADEAACTAAAADLAPRMQAVHAECKAKPARKSKEG